MEWSATTPQSSEGSSSPPPSQSSSALPQARLLSAGLPTSAPQSLQLRPSLSPKYSLIIVQDRKTKDHEWYAFQIAENTNNPVDNIEVPRTLRRGFVPFIDEPYHRNSNKIPILKPNFRCAEEEGRPCSAAGMNSNFYWIPGQTLVKNDIIQICGPSNLVYIHSLNHSLNPTVPPITMPIDVKYSHPIILDESLYCLGGSSSWACSMNITTGRWISFPNPPFVPPNMSSIFSVVVKNTHPYIVVGYKDSRNRILQLFNVFTELWSTVKFQPNLNDQILDPPTNQPVAVDSKFFWYDALKQWVVGYDLFSCECYLAEVNTHDRGARDSQPRLAFISGGDDGSLCFCLQWLSPTTINGSPMVKFHCLKFLLAQNQLPSGSTIFLDRRVLACQTFLVWGGKSFVDAMVGIGQLECPYLSHERQLEN